jgi:hypothetical protein
MTISPPHRALRGLLGTEGLHLPQPRVRDGYSVARRALAGLLGVRLAEPEKQTRPLSPSAGMSAGEVRHVSAAAVIVAVDPLVRLTVRLSPLVAATLMADLLVRAHDIADSLTSSGARVEDLTFTRTLSRNLASDLDRVLDRARVVTQNLAWDLVGDLDLVLARDLAHAEDLALALDLDGDRDLLLALDHDPARVFDIAFDRAFNRALQLTRDLTRDLALNIVLDHALARTLGRALGRDLVRDLALDRNLSHAISPDFARELAFALAGVLSDLLWVEHLHGLTDALFQGALDDFSQADLSEANVAQIDMAGVRWSVSKTRWPAGLDVGAVIERSEEVTPGSGVYVIKRWDKRKELARVRGAVPSQESERSANRS